MKFKSASVLIFISLISFSEFLFAGWALCSLPSYPTAADIPDDVSYFWVKSPSFGIRGAIIEARKENHPTTLLPDVKFYLPPPFSIYAYSSDISSTLPFSGFKWSARCYYP